MLTVAYLDVDAFTPRLTCWPIALLMYAFHVIHVIFIYHLLGCRLRYMSRRERSVDRSMQSANRSTRARLADALGAFTVGTSFRGRKAATHARNSVKEECSE